MQKNYVVGSVFCLSLMISIGNYLIRNQVPIYTKMLTLRSSVHLSCINITCECGNLSNTDVRGPYIAPGPSKVKEMVPMSVLRKNVLLNSFEGLRYLDQNSLSRFYQCHASDKPYVHGKVKWCTKRRFLDQRLPLVALVSFHGSGNTWLRYLLEQVTGVFTGSIYCDGVLKMIFPGESVVTGNVIAIKTHHADTRELPKDVQVVTGKKVYDKAIILVRNPFDALVSEANRRWNSKRSLNEHVGLADETNFISK